MIANIVQITMAFFFLVGLVFMAKACIELRKDIQKGNTTWKELFRNMVFVTSIYAVVTIAIYTAFLQTLINHAKTYHLF